MKKCKLNLGLPKAIFEFTTKAPVSVFFPVSTLLTFAHFSHFIFRVLPSPNLLSDTMSLKCSGNPHLERKMLEINIFIYPAMQ